MHTARAMQRSTTSVFLTCLLIAGSSDVARAGGANPDEPPLVPRPRELSLRDGSFELRATTPIVFDAGNDVLAEIAGALATELEPALGAKPPVGDAAPDGGPVLVLSVAGADAALGDEGYELAVESERVLLRASSTAGVFRGTQTLRQLCFPGWAPGGAKRVDAVRIPALRIVDAPRYRHRGLLLDCGRHFMPKEFVKRTIDLLAYHKLNVLHWHLTEDQGWRIEIQRYPKLTEVGAWRRATRESEQPRDADGRYGGFYSQADVREIVDYARRRHITVIPEIEMPGHSLAALASYPELSCAGGPLEVGTTWGVFDDVYCAGNDEVFAFLEGVLSEVIELFPSPYVHVGGDECPKTRWKTCPKCQARMRAEGLKDEHELQSYFIRRLERFLSSKGRRLIGWDEILEGGLAPNATVQSWRGMDGAIAAATSGHDVIASPTSHCYLDYAQGRNPGEPMNMGFLPLEVVYSFEPTPAALTAEQARHVLGVQGNMWTEHAPPALVDRQVWPRLCAIAECGWTPAARRDFDDFRRRMKTHYQRLDALGVKYYVAPPRMLVDGKPLIDAALIEPVEVVLESAFDGGELRYTLDGDQPKLNSLPFERPIRIAEPTHLQARVFLPTGHASAIAEARFRKLTPKEPAAVGATSPGLRWDYYEGYWSRLPEFDKLTPVAAGVCGVAAGSAGDETGAASAKSAGAAEGSGAGDARSGGTAETTGAADGAAPGARDRSATPSLTNENATAKPFALRVARRADGFGLRFAGYYEAPRDGVYTFYLASDDGSRLWIGDELIVDHDGAHSVSERAGRVWLRPGKHALRVEYFEGSGSAVLRVEHEGPQLEKQPIGASVLSREASTGKP
ncbi:MAG: family 20 glycosylhydrolase [Phycisphaerae bacterium]